MNLKSVLRSVQSNAAVLRPIKFGAYNLGTRLIGQPMEAEFKLLSSIGPTALALDVGGNWGQSIAALKRTAKPRKTISFEPNPVLAERLQRQYARDATVEVENFALSNSEGEFNLYLPFYRNYLYDGLASLDYDEAHGWFTAERFAWFDPEQLRIESVVVKTKTLDSLALSPDIVKIDVQGAEEFVIEGGLSTFERCQPITIIECPTETIVETMASFGLAAYCYAGGKLDDWKMHTNNVIFLTDAQRRKCAL